MLTRNLINQRSLLVRSLIDVVKVSNVNYHEKVSILTLFRNWMFYRVNLANLKVIDHYENPRNVGSLDKKDLNVGTGLVGMN